ncbi:MAG TPA: BrnA antitoxin family protein [Candidatus Angelobacter sp.]|nr:BrnA antitoxin family protein [Candidatus Angelobacter sp.]
MKDDEIDFSDSPEIDESFLSKAFLWPGPKELISLRRDREVLAFFRKQGKGYQTTINALLRKYMEAQMQLGDQPSEKRAKKK